MSIRNDESLRWHIDKRKCIYSYQRQMLTSEHNAEHRHINHYIFAEIGTDFPTNEEQ